VCTTCAQPVGLFDLIGQHAAVVWVDAQVAFERGNGALVAVAAFADPAGNPYRFIGLRGVDVEVISIDERACVFDLAAETNGVAARGRIIRSAGF